MILSFGNEWRVGDALTPERRLARFASFVGGPRSSSVLTEHSPDPRRGM
ncbi:MAG: hypothetical protein M3540_09495 [Actinomycetota bacterium]|nr:hypothetical protein [Actinomycetota bacterium]